MLWWAMRIAPVLVRGRNALLDGQVRRSFIVSGCEQAGIADYQPVLIDCSDQIRRTRLVGDRAQPELANPDMLRWADFLRKEAIGCGDPIIGTDNLSVNVAVELIRQMLVS